MPLSVSVSAKLCTPCAAENESSIVLCINFVTTEPRVRDTYVWPRTIHTKPRERALSHAPLPSWERLHIPLPRPFPAICTRQITAIRFYRLTKHFVADLLHGAKLTQLQHTHMHGLQPFFHSIACVSLPIRIQYMSGTQVLIAKVQLWDQYWTRTNYALALCSQLPWRPQLFIPTWCGKDKMQRLMLTSSLISSMEDPPKLEERDIYVSIFAKNAIQLLSCIRVKSCQHLTSAAGFLAGVAQDWCILPGIYLERRCN